ncbi:MAG: N-acetylmuramoyl-L-alanine amidase [Candidatus Magnetobacterium sp. LHC-1]|uniref:N-acetylmuramoyl-L-alanine amidase n=1 Tax=Candidatus Magnetobacterium casense TaxID=1455061 RepID=A0ABS6RWL8_9BACT|nr:N-acetylmuramoyl-L-alanine amidase [Candidatus Magnetobacterium casensis]MBF0607259.1 N-acetylmuramoyl-L-alanine amidase [Nitrospirota bacterium]MBV6340735.1 N-acetylmuramoyl-L-alanine amidase [Candidatus Magnetobacterium casensis]
MPRVIVGIILRGVVFVLLLLSYAGADCGDGTFVVAIDVGHSKKSPGATSARGQSEYDFNKAVATLLLKELRDAGITGAFMIDANGISLKERVLVANSKKSDLFVSIHHDSVQPVYLSTWEHNGKTYRYSDMFKGFSIFYSGRNASPTESLAFADILGGALLEAGLRPTLHHAENIPGENRELVDQAKGIYRFDDLVVLANTQMPAVLLECGVIVNREEELLLKSTYMELIVSALVRSIVNWCVRRP